MKNFTPLILALGVVGVAATACTPSATTSTGQGPSGMGAAASEAVPAAAPPGMGSGTAQEAGTGSAGISTGHGGYLLQAMPAGTVSITRGAEGHLLAHVKMFGLTPGSAHTMVIEAAGQVYPFPGLTADAAGDADVTLASAGRIGQLRPGSRAVIDLGNAESGSLAAEPIAETGALHLGPAVAFHAVTAAQASASQDGASQDGASQDGASLATPRGRADLTFNAAAQTLTVTVTASGLTPGPHAAHIHLGSCRQQGAVKYMMADFDADARGNIVNQSRIITGVTSVPGPGAWYLNLHQGGMNQILANGVPTLYFRPMLCADLSTFATAGPATAGQPMQAATPTMGATAPAMPTAAPPMTAMPMPAMPTSVPATTPVSAPSVIPTGVPTHY